ncbi:hypothetical protein QAD02_010043 [Eretmocerus hayati]|uniref:Uncharacterized protein n=1 Tax=Eretmocerus hayati TaxID=131215 RepID=A0ACC2NB27_9HYME|nr:hypothetical protein QAD02_010043 [Eretmocerus hayati]
MRGIKTAPMNRKRLPTEPLLEEYKFVPFIGGDEMYKEDIVRTVCQIVHENHHGYILEVAELIDETMQTSLVDTISHSFSKAFREIVGSKIHMSVITSLNAHEDEVSTDKFKIVHPDDLKTMKNLSIAIGSRLFEPDQAHNLQLLISKLEPRGFLVAKECNNHQDVRTAALTAGLDIILGKTCGKDTLILARKKEIPNYDISIVQVENDNFKWVEEMRSRMLEIRDRKDTKTSRVLLISENDFDSGLLGLVTCLNRELGNEVIRGVLIQDPDAPKFSIQNPFYAEHLAKDLKLSVLRKNGVWGTYRHLPLSQVQMSKVDHVFAEQRFPGDLSSFCWRQGPIDGVSDPTSLVRVIYSSINFKDIMLATNKLPREYFDKNGNLQKSHIGFEFSGYDANGEKIMGISKTTSFSNLLPADTVLTIPVPKSWSLEDAATVFTVYATAYYALYIRGGLRKKDKVLIHAGSGGVGQAAIVLCLHEGCEVFTTVGTPEKRKFIRDVFPQIQDDHIGDSRSTKFKEMIMKQTNDYGVDVVLNSLAEEKLIASMECVATGGRFLEIGKYDFVVNNKLGMEVFLKDISFHGVMLDSFIYESEENMITIRRYLLDGIQSGVVQPIKRTVFPRADIEAAFRYMAAGKHIGKVILKVQDDEEPSACTPIEATSRYYCMQDKSYVILGGLGGVGLELVDWLIQRGAKNVVISSRSGIKTGYQKLKLRKWEMNGARILIINGKDASRYEDCKFILEAATQFAFVDGIFNLAAVTKDAIWENQTPESFRDVLQSKAETTKNLDTLSRITCPKLRHFVVFSSTISGKGHVGTSNYGMANSVIERICERRASENLPALAIQWGPIKDVGLFSDLYESGKDRLAEFGYVMQKIPSVFEELDKFLNQSKPVVSCMILSEKKFSASTTVTPFETVMNILGISSTAGMSLSTPLSETGMDSILAVEAIQALEEVHGISITMAELRSLTIKDSQEMSGNKAIRGRTLADSKFMQANQADPIHLQLKNILSGLQFSEIERAQQFVALNEIEGREVFLISGLVGFSSDFGILKECLEVPAVCLQLRFDSTDSLRDMAEQFVQHVSERSEPKKEFLLVGYAFGALVAIELARLLELAGLHGKLLLIDGAPKYLKRSILMDAQSFTVEDLENYILVHLINILSPESNSQFVEVLKGRNEWNDKLQAFLYYSSGSKLNLSNESQKYMVRALIARCKAVLDYDKSSSPRVKVPITLIKPTITSIQFPEEDYGLSEITEGPIRILYADGDHASMLKDKTVTNAINEMTSEAFI